MKIFKYLIAIYFGTTMGFITISLLNKIGEPYNVIVGVLLGIALICFSLFLFGEL